MNNFDEGAEQPAPHIPEDLLRHLRSVFRDCLPSIDISDRELGRRIGQVDVVRHLETVREHQKEDALNVS